MSSVVPSALLLGGMRAAMAPQALRFYHVLERPEAAQAECLRQVLRAVAGTQQAARIPGWNDGHEFAPHPVALRELDPDEEV